MAKINLTRSFILRQRLRSIINNITNALSYASIWIEESTTYPDKTVVPSNQKPFEYKGMNLQETYELLTKGNEFILTLNNLIDEANVIKARKIINEIEVEKGKVAMLKNLANDYKNYKDSSSSYSSYTNENNVHCRGIVTTKNIRTNDYNWVKALDECEKKIVFLEDELSDANSTTFFEVPDELLQFIKENI